MSADLNRPPHPAREIDRVLRRRSTDRMPTAGQTDSSIAEPSLRTRKGDVEQLLADIATRSVSDPDMVDILRRRADGSLDVVKLTDEQAVALGLMKPTWRMRLRAWWRAR